MPHSTKQSEANMQLSVSTSQQQIQLDYSRLAFNQSSSSPEKQVLQSPLDRVRLSDEAKHGQKTGQHVKHLHKLQQERNENPMSGLLKDIVEQITGASINKLQQQPYEDSAPALSTVGSSSFSAQQASLTIEARSLSIEGTITSSDGATLSFALGLQISHANASAVTMNSSSGPDGNNFSFAGSSIDLTSSSFSFSMTAELPDGSKETGNGFGTLSLKDDIKDIRHSVKPLTNEFLKETGMPSDWQNTNKLLSALA